MMFVFGEVQEPLLETINLVEDIVRSQVIEIVRIFRIVNIIVMNYKKIFTIY
jgi:transcription initiation protein SPT3